MLYSGGFFSTKEKQLIQEINKLKPEKLSIFSVPTKEVRLAEMFFRYKARNYPESLTEPEKQQWQQFCRARLLEKNTQGFLGLQDYRETLAALKQQGGVSAALLMDLEQYADGLEKQLQS